MSTSIKNILLLFSLKTFLTLHLYFPTQTHSITHTHTHTHTNTPSLSQKTDYIPKDNIPKVYNLKDTIPNDYIPKDSFPKIVYPKIANPLSLYLKNEFKNLTQPNLTKLELDFGSTCRGCRPQTTPGGI